MEGGDVSPRAGRVVRFPGLPNKLCNPGAFNHGGSFSVSSGGQEATVTGSAGSVHLRQ